MTQELSQERLENIKGRFVQFDNYEQVERCIRANGAEFIRFIDWTTNTVEVLNHCHKCGRVIDVKYVACVYCWSHGSEEDGETFEGDDY